jgi:hypothetical protein
LRRISASTVAPRREVAQRLLGSDETGPRRTVHHGAGVEAVLRAERRFDLVVIALLDRSLDDDVQVLGAAVALDDDVAWTEIADVERRTQLADLLVREPIERRIVTVERLRHEGMASTTR